MAAEATAGADLKGQVLEHFRQKGKMMTMQQVARDLNLDHRAAKKVLTELINDGELEFTSFGGATFIKLVEKG